jgi:hypothetical protein
MFFLEAEDFKLNVPGHNFMIRQAHKIIYKYIAQGAPQGVSPHHFQKFKLCHRGDSSYGQPLCLTGRASVSVSGD